MLKKQKKFIAFIIALSIIISSNFQVFAVSKLAKQDVGSKLNEAIDFVAGNYVGQDVSKDKLYESAMEGVFSSLDDYSTYYNKEDFKAYMKGFENKMTGIGIMIKLNQNSDAEIIKVIKNSPAEKSNIKVGDIIKAVNDKDIKGVAIPEIMQFIAEKDTVLLKILRDNKITTYSLKKDVVEVDSIYYEKIAKVLPNIDKAQADNIGYISIDQMIENTDKEFKNAIENLKKQNVSKVIIDLRSNPGGIMEVTLEMCKMIVPEGVITSTKDKSGEVVVYKSELKEQPFKEVVILTNSNTASAAEMFTSAMQDSKAAKVVGQTTFGKGIGQSVVELKSGEGIVLTTIEYFTRNGKKVNKIGIVPDVMVDVAPYISNDFYLDSKNSAPEIIELKKALVYLGNKIDPITSTYDEKTEKIISSYQKNKGFSPDGRLTYQTLKALNEDVYKKESKEDLALKKGYEILKGTK